MASGLGALFPAAETTSELLVARGGFRCFVTGTPASPGTPLPTPSTGLQGLHVSSVDTPLILRGNNSKGVGSSPSPGTFVLISLYLPTWQKDPRPAHLPG